MPEELFEEEDGCLTDRGGRVVFRKSYDGYIRNSSGYPVGVIHHGDLYFQEEKLNFEEREKVWNDSVNCRKNYYLKRNIEKEESPTVVKKEVEPKSNKETSNINLSSLNFDSYNSDPKNIAIRDLYVQIYNQQNKTAYVIKKDLSVVETSPKNAASLYSKGEVITWTDNLNRMPVGYSGIEGLKKLAKEIIRDEKYAKASNLRKFGMMLFGEFVEEFF